MSEAVLPGPIRQVGYVVRDLDRTIAAWLALGIGPWFTMRELPQVGCTYRGALSEPVLSIAFANSGDMQLELIQQHGDTPSIYTEFLDSGREGYQQLAWWVDDFDAMEERARSAGWNPVFAGDGNGATRFVYYEADPLVTTVLEVMELNASTRWLTEHVREGAESWTPGTDDVRPLF